MLKFTSTIRILILAVLAAGQTPLWLHEYTAHRGGISTSAGTNHSCHGCVFHQGSGTQSKSSAWVDDHECSLCYQLSQATAPPNVLVVEHVAEHQELWTHSTLPEVDTEAFFQAARGPPAFFA